MMKGIVSEMKQMEKDDGPVRELFDANETNLSI